MSNFLSRSISQETLRASNSGEKHREGELKNTSSNSAQVLKAVQSGQWGEALKNASLRNGKEKEIPAWLITYQKTIGSNGATLSNNIAEEEELKQASSSYNNNNKTNSIPNWLITFRNSGGQL